MCFHSVIFVSYEDCNNRNINGVMQEFLTPCPGIHCTTSFLPSSRAGKVVGSSDLPETVTNVTILSNCNTVIILNSTRTKSSFEDLACGQVLSFRCWASRCRLGMTFETVIKLKFHHLKKIERQSEVQDTVDATRCPVSLLRLLRRRQNSADDPKAYNYPPPNFIAHNQISLYILTFSNITLEIAHSF